MMAVNYMQLASAGIAVIAAAFAGFSLWQAAQRWIRSRRHKDSIANADAAKAPDSGKSLNSRVIALVEEQSRIIALKPGALLVPAPLAKRPWLEHQADLAGLAGSVTEEGFSQSQAILGVTCAFAGLACGAMFSVPLAMVLAIVGFALGWRLPGHAVKGRVQLRAHETERHLPEMLDVVALGMRSGLSFDASLSLYESHFDTMLARELESVQRQWTSGLIRRDEGLRKLAASYDSVIFSRVVETIIRSVRYGASMVSSLESDAAEARGAYQLAREERIAKAPVKMMIPTGTLILPAMLILVLGPVLLELLQGGF